jgi:hypothetical protein
LFRDITIEAKDAKLFDQKWPEYYKFSPNPEYNNANLVEATGRIYCEVIPREISRTPEILTLDRTSRFKKGLKEKPIKRLLAERRSIDQIVHMLGVRYQEPIS